MKKFFQFNFECIEVLSMILLHLRLIRILFKTYFKLKKQNTNFEINSKQNF